MAYYGNDEDYEVPSEPYGEDEGSELEQLIENQEQELTSAEEKHQFEIEEKLLRNKLRQIFRDVSVSSRTSFKITEKVVIKKAKEHPNLKNEINRVNMALNSNKAKNISKLMSSSPLLMYMLIGALILFLIVAVIAFVGSIMPWLFPDEENPEGDVSSVFGITGADFYGARMVYVDDERANQSIVEEYVEFVENGIVKAEQITTISVGGINYNVDLNIEHINLPTEEYDYSVFDETEFYSNYTKLHAVVLSIAKETYKVDNGVDYSGSILSECVGGIKYFGYGDLTLIAPMVAEEIVTIESISATDGEGNAITDTTILGLIEDEVETKLVENYNSNSTYLIRTEKLFVKDYIIDGDDARISGVQKENYVAMIFMAKKNVTFTSFSFAVGNANLTNFEISMDGVNFGTDGSNLGTEEKPSFIYSSGTVNVGANAFEDININNLNALSQGMSLLDVVENVNNYSVYLNTATDENSVEYLTVKKNGVVVNLFNTEAFNFVEFESNWMVN